MADHLGQLFEGVISGVTEWGVYVELNDNKCEGMIPIRDLGENDYFFFDEQNYCVVGRRSNRKFQLGDPITVRVVRADLIKKQLDFALPETKVNTPKRTPKVETNKKNYTHKNKKRRR